MRKSSSPSLSAANPIRPSRRTARARTVLSLYAVSCAGQPPPTGTRQRLNWPEMFDTKRTPSPSAVNASAGPNFRTALKRSNGGRLLMRQTISRCFHGRDEADRLSLVRSLAAGAVVADAHGERRAAADGRARGRGGGDRNRRRVRARAPLRPPAGVAVPAACGDRRPHE